MSSYYVLAKALLFYTGFS